MDCLPAATRDSFLDESGDQDKQHDCLCSNYFTDAKCQSERNGYRKLGSHSSRPEIQHRRSEDGITAHNSGEHSNQIKAIVGLPELEPAKKHGEGHEPDTGVFAPFGRLIVNLNARCRATVYRPAVPSPEDSAKRLES